jgi:hypothetical protein
MKQRDISIIFFGAVADQHCESFGGKISEIEWELSEKRLERGGEKKEKKKVSHKKTQEPQLTQRHSDFFRGSCGPAWRVV